MDPAPSGGSAFYADLYLGLFNEAKGETELARHYIVAAAASPYGRESRDYMHALAVVHKQQQYPGAVSFFS